MSQFAKFKKQTPSNQIKKPAKVLGGWDDDEEEPKQQANDNIQKQGNFSQKFSQAEKKPQQTESMPKFEQKENKFIQKKEPVSNLIKFQSDYDLLEGEILESNQLKYEKLLIDKITNPGGLKLKQPQQILKQFVDDCKPLQHQVIGSFLIAKLFQEDSEFKSKIKSLFAIQELIKDNKKLQEYMKFNIEIMKEFPKESDKEDQYKRELDYIQKLIENPLAVQQSSHKNIHITYKQPIKQNNQNNNNIIDDFLDMGQSNQNQQPQQKKRFGGFQSEQQDDLLGGVTQQQTQIQQQPQQQQQSGTSKLHNLLKKKQDKQQNQPKIVNKNILQNPLQQDLLSDLGGLTFQDQDPSKNIQQQAIINEQPLQQQPELDDPFGITGQPKQTLYQKKIQESKQNQQINNQQQSLLDDFSQVNVQQTQQFQQQQPFYQQNQTQQQQQQNYNFNVPHPQTQKQGSTDGSKLKFDKAKGGFVLEKPKDNKESVFDNLDF